MDDQACAMCVLDEVRRRQQVIRRAVASGVNRLEGEPPAHNLSEHTHH
jgi:hypothetical protein